ncbi:STAS domain-containing protein [Planomonospora sp. ID67723]|nr:STAS domain-containing protein [Planomonospora sp. ID67723]
MGELDASTVPAFEAKLAELTDDSRPVSLVVDLTAVTFVSSAALGALVQARLAVDAACGGRPSRRKGLIGLVMVVAGDGRMTCRTLVPRGKTCGSDSI